MSIFPDLFFIRTCFSENTYVNFQKHVRESVKTCTCFYGNPTSIFIYLIIS